MCQEGTGMIVSAEAFEFLAAMLMIHIDSELLPESGYSDATRCWLSKWFVSVSHPLQAGSLLPRSHSSNLIQPYPASSEWQRRASSDWTNHYVNNVNAFKRSETLRASHTAAAEERRKDVTEQGQKRQAWLMKDEREKKKMTHTGRQVVLLLCFHWAGVEARDDTFPLSTSKNCEHTLGALSLPGEDSGKRQHCPFIPQMNVNSTTAAYLRVPYACRQPKIRAPSTHELLEHPSLSLQPPKPTKQRFHGSQTLYIIISRPKSPRLGLFAHILLLP